MHRVGTDYHPEMDADLARLQAERRTQAATVITHLYWESIEPGDRWQARSALHHAAP